MRVRNELGHGIAQRIFAPQKKTVSVTTVWILRIRFCNFQIPPAHDRPASIIRFLMADSQIRQFYDACLWSHLLTVYTFPRLMDGFGRRSFYTFIMGASAFDARLCSQSRPCDRLCFMSFIFAGVFRSLFSVQHYTTKIISAPDRVLDR